jgi:excisionase family DNA binding protein
MVLDHSGRIRIGEAAKIIGVDPGTIRRWIALGHLNGIRTPGNRWLVERSSVESLIAESSQRN